MLQDSAISDTVTEFIRQIGFGDFSWSGEPLTLSFDHTGTLHIEPTLHGLLLARFVEINEYDIINYVPKALRSVHYDQQLPLLVQTGMKGDHQLAFMTTLAPRQLTVSGLNEALSLLDHLHHQLTQ